MFLKKSGYSENMCHSPQNADQLYFLKDSLRQLFPFLKLLFRADQQVLKELFRNQQPDIQLKCNSVPDLALFLPDGFHRFLKCLR